MTAGLDGNSEFNLRPAGIVTAGSAERITDNKTEKRRDA
jgi:hypothetical protein